MNLSKIKPSVANIHLLFTAILVAMIPFARYMLSWAIVCWLLTGIILMLTNRKEVSKMRLDFGVIIGILLYLSFVAGVFYSENQSKALFDIQVKMSLVIFPPFIYLLRKFYRRNFHFVMIVFVLSNIVAGLICLSLAFSQSFHVSEGIWLFNTSVPGVYNDINTSPPSYFSYSLFSIFQHPAYYSMYLVLCVFYLIYLYRNSVFVIKSAVISKVLYLASIFFLVFIIYLLESKAAYLSLLLLMLIYFVSFMILKKKWLWGVIIILAILAVSIIGFSYNSRFYYIKTALKNNNSFVNAIKDHNYKVLIDTYGIDRIPIWIISTEIIEENFWAGVGSGDVNEVLIKRYKHYQLQTLVNNNYNTHNQYLGTFIAVGLIGFLIMMGWLIYPLFRKRHFSKEGFLISVFIGIVSINFLFESALNTIAGVVFIAFFYSFLLFVPGSETGD
jgi:O-antigen ligase